MYERFTDRARKVMSLANQEAQRFNHEYIGTEHILLGLIKEGAGVAAYVLKNLDVDLRKVRLEVEKLVQSGPDMVTMGKLPQTPRAKKVIEYSMIEARNLKHNYVGTEHILLGLLREQEGVAGQVLTNLGVDTDEVRSELLNLLGHGIDGVNRIALMSDSIEIKTDVPSIIEFPTIPKGPVSCEVYVQCPPTQKELDKETAMKQLRKLLVQQAEITTQMLKLLRDIL